MDKENYNENISPLKYHDLSFYDENPTTSSSSINTCTNPSPSHQRYYHNSNNNEPGRSSSHRRPLGDHYDQNSRDSGYATNFYNSQHYNESNSTTALITTPSTNSKHNSSMDYDLLEEFADIEPLEDSNLPQDFNKLLYGSLLVCNEGNQSISSSSNSSHSNSHRITATNSCNTTTNQHDNRGDVVETIRNHCNSSKRIIKGNSLLLSSPTIRPLFKSKGNSSGGELSTIISPIRLCLFKKKSSSVHTNDTFVPIFKKRSTLKTATITARRASYDSDDTETIDHNKKKVKFNTITVDDYCEQDDDKDADEEQQTATSLLHSVNRVMVTTTTTTTTTTKPVLQRAFSATEESIMCALQRSTTVPDLIGDFSKTFCLPLVDGGRHYDLKSITPHTLAELILGTYKSINGPVNFEVIDCRFPYEYNGGHIRDARNIYTRDQCIQLLLTNSTSKTNCWNHHHHLDHNILVFHCEFSSERGPALYLREQDRQLNEEVYPSLHYPEIYLLKGGYKSFYEKYPLLCIPNAYKQMLHPAHEQELRYFRQKSKTWSAPSTLLDGGGHRSSTNRLNFIQKKNSNP